MKIGVDMLPLKTGSNIRGIGKYTFNLVNELVNTDGSNKYYLYNVPKDIADNFKKNNVFIFERKPISSDTSGLDIFFIASLLEDRDNDILVPSQIKCRKALLFYDLIPVIFWEKYVDSLSDKERYEYFRRLNYIKDFDIIFAISKTSKVDLAELVGIPENKIKVIYAGLDKNFLREKRSNGEIARIKAKYGINGRFVLSTVGYDFRKNISGIFNAFCNVRNNLELVIVCKLQPEVEKQLYKNWVKLGLSKNRLILTNYIPVEDLISLYDAADASLFPSLYEGFGLPVLESMARGCPVVTSKVSSLPEVCECAALYIDPDNPKEIAEAIDKIVTDIDLKEKLIKLGLEQFKKFNWTRVAAEILENLEFFCPQNFNENSAKYRVAYFSPLNPVKSGISDYSEELLPVLKNSIDIDIFIDEGYSPVNNNINNLFDVYPHFLFERMNKENKYDLCLYQLGNSIYHEYILKYLLKYPGLIVLHDLTLFGLISSICNKNKTFDKIRFLNYVFENLGYIKYLEIKDKLDRKKLIDAYDLSQNFAKMFLDHSILTLVHNDFSKDFLENQVSFCKIWATRLHGIDHELDHKIKEDIKAQLGISSKIVISAFGRITFTKRIDVLLKSFSKLINKKNVKNVQLFLVGELHNDVKQQIQNIIKNEGLEDVTTITGYVSKDEFEKYLEISDICVNLRFPTSGESSATLAKALSFGIPVITTNYAQYREYPDNCCWKVDVGVDEIELISEYLLELVTNEKLRKIMSENAYCYAKTNHSLNKVVNDYLRAINYSIKQKIKYKNTIDEMV